MNQGQDDCIKIEQTIFRLTVKAVRDETPDARSFVLVAERGDAPQFKYRSGQFLTFSIPFEGREILRSYSLSSARCFDPEMTVCVKRVEGGRGSNWFNDKLVTGARINAKPPAGRFVLKDNTAPLFLIAGGSGITPCMSLIKQALIETKRQVKLVYANQNARSVIYREQLGILASRFIDRFICHHWLDDERGFLSPKNIEEASKNWQGSDFYVCGPGPLMDMAETTLIEVFGLDANVMTERFVSPDDPEPVTIKSTPPACIEEHYIDEFRLILDDAENIVPISAGQTLMEAALAANIDAPNSCIEGHCGTCMAHLKNGEVSMSSTKALSKRNIERGFVLACQSRPSSSQPIILNFDI